MGADFEVVAGPPRRPAGAARSPRAGSPAACRLPACGTVGPGPAAGPRSGGAGPRARTTAPAGPGGNAPGVGSHRPACDEAPTVLDRLVQRQATGQARSWAERAPSIAQASAHAGGSARPRPRRDRAADRGGPAQPVAGHPRPLMFASASTKSTSRLENAAAQCAPAGVNRRPNQVSASARAVSAMTVSTTTDRRIGLQFGNGEVISLHQERADVAVRPRPAPVSGQRISGRPSTPAGGHRYPGSGARAQVICP